MIFELNENDYQLVMAGLGEMKGKYSTPIMNKLEAQKQQQILKKGQIKEGGGEGQSDTSDNNPPA